MMEIWRDIEGYKGLYQISNKGRVKSLYKGSERILRPCIDGSGYMFVGLYHDNIRKYFKLHRLVAQAFIPNPHNLPEINHRDENKKNNCVENLEWMIHRDNLNYGTRNERVGDLLSKPILQYSKSGEFIREWQGSREAERILGIANSNIIACCKGRYKSAGGFIWKYKEERTE